jgi:regulator of nucleoside diphosphate kinase
MTLPDRTIRAIDQERLHAVAIAALGDARTAVAASMLLSEMARARVTRSRSLPAGVVAMHRETEIRDNVTNARRCVRLVYPGEDAGAEAVSVLTSLGAMLLGLPEGASVEWCTPARDRQSVTVLRARYRRAKRKMESGTPRSDASNETGMRSSHRVRGHQPVPGRGQDAGLGGH